ncbi:MAG: hypothetical protein HS113_28070 [Verrucomicrobiales bacterium]|nr:hypothetical protein [Verrucomicrobiales bacterium]
MQTAPKLAILVPDGAYPLILAKLLTVRRQSLAIAAVAFEIIKDVFHDSSPEVITMLRPYLRTCTHVLVFRDLHGSGWEDLKGCRVPSFQRLLATLRAWFPSS